MNEQTTGPEAQSVLSSKFKVQSLKFENAPEMNQKTWNLEHGTLNLIALPAVCFQLLAGKVDAGERIVL